MAEAPNFESTGLVNNGDGITLKYSMSIMETSFFAVNYYIQNRLNFAKLYRKNYVTTFFQCLLDYLHVIPFLVHHGLNYGEVSLAWAKFANWIQLQLPIYTYAPFSIAFWVTVVAMAVLLGLCVFIGYSHWNKTPGQSVAISIASVALTGGFQLFFPAAFYLLVLPWFCNYRTQTLFNFIQENPQCFTGPNLIAVIIGTMSAITLLAFACFSSLIKSSVEPIVNDLSITTGVLFKNQYYFTIAFMTINKFLIAPSIGPESFGTWWEALFNMIAMTLLVFTIVYFLPYQEMAGNQARGFAFTSLWWISCVSFMSVNIAPNPGLINRQLDYILIAGLLPFGILGEFLIKSRYAHMSTFATALTEEIKVAQENKRRAAAKAAELGVTAEKKITGPRLDAKKTDEKKDGKDTKGSTKGKTAAETKTGGKPDPNKEEADKIQAAQKAAMLAMEQKNEDDDKKRNTRLYLPKILREYNAGITTIDIIGRLLWHRTDDKTAIEAAGALYEAAEKAYPEVPYVKVLRTSYATSLATDPSVHLPKLDLIKKMEPGLLSRYYVYKRTVDIRDRTKVSGTSDGDNTLDLIAYIEFQNLFNETKKYNNRAIESIREFWMLFLQKTITAAAFNRAAKEMDMHSQKAVLIYKTMLTKFPKNHQVLTSYAFFLDLVLRNTEEAQRCIRRADEQKAREAEEARAGNVAGQIDSQAVVAITEDASIDQVNKALLTLFGYTRNEVLGRNIKLLVPSPWKEHHDNILQRYRVTGIAKVIGKTQTLYGHHKEGYAFSIRLLVQERRKENGERNFVGMIQPNTDTKTGVVIINEMGIIKMVTKQTLDLFGGYTAGQLLNKNVVILMIDSFAAGHDNYLKRYKETGEARVIGTAGRNVPAKRKDGSTFPASLTIEENYANGERYWLANIQDTSDTTGSIFIDGFGTIQNSDMGIQALLGYKKEDIVGKNIKGIMPPPYCDYHDMYLERYRRTKVSNVLRLVEGRILPAVHADGSVVQLRAIIQRADSGDSSGAGGNQSMLFKGVIKRGDINTGAGSGDRRGYVPDYEIEMNRAGVITKLHRKVLTMLGHPKDRHISDFIGQPIEVLVPVLPDRPSQQKSNWFTRALKSPELNFYLVMVNKNYTLLPVTYCLEENEDGAIRMRVRDLSELDALLNIDEVGNVLSLNEDAFMLLGFDPDEVIGRNIKYIQPPEVAEHHDMYLQRYKDTGVARVVGINRSVEAMHRDGSYFPNEIQVTEQVSADGSKIFIGRLRHVKFNDRCEKEIVQRYMVNTKSLATAMSTISADGQSAMSMTSDGARKINFRGKKGSSKGSSKGSRALGSGQVSSIHDDLEGHSVLSNSLNSSSMNSGSNGESSISSNTKFLTLLSKLKTIKNSAKEDPSNTHLGTVLNYILGIYVVFFSLGLIITNSLQTPIPYYELLNNLMNLNVVINELIYAGFTLELQQIPEKNLMYCSWTNGSTSKPYCPWLIAATLGRNPIVDKDALPNYPVNAQFPVYHTELLYRFPIVSSEYKKIRKAGDLFDRIIQGEYKAYQFVNGSASVNSTTSLQTFWNLMGTLSDVTSVLAQNLDLEERSIRAWNWLIGNRNALCQSIRDLANLIPGQSKEAISNAMIFHLIMAIMSVAIGVLSFMFLLVPRIRQVQVDREKILRLLLLMPKSSVYDLVHRVYTTADEDDDEFQKQSNDDNEDLDEEEDAEVDDIDGGEGEAQEITVVADRSIGIYSVFILGLAALSVPIISHTIYRFADDQVNTETVTLIENMSTLYLDMLITSWQIFTTAVNCKPGEDVFCIQPYPTALLDMERYIDSMERAYNKAIKSMQGNAGVIEVFTQSMCFDTPNGLYRCFTPKSTMVSNTSIPLMPSNFLSKTFNGYSNLVQNTIRSARRLISDVRAQYQIGGIEAIRNATDSADDFWFLYEIPLLEGEAGINMSFRRAKDYLQAALRSGIVAANICYTVGLGVSFIVFFWVFGSVRKAITTETRLNRGALYMVPHDVLRNTKAMIEYIEELHTGLGV